MEKRKLSTFGSYEEYLAEFISIAKTAARSMLSDNPKYQFAEEFCMELCNRIREVIDRYDILIRVEFPAANANHFGIMSYMPVITDPDVKWSQTGREIQDLVYLSEIIGTDELNQVCRGVHIPFSIVDYPVPHREEIEGEFMKPNTPPVSVCRSLIYGALASSYRVFGLTDRDSIANAIHRAYAPSTPQDKLLAIGMSRFNPMMPWEVAIDGAGISFVRVGGDNFPHHTSHTCYMNNFAKLWNTGYRAVDFMGRALLEDNPAMVVTGTMKVRLDYMEAIFKDDDDELASRLDEDSILVDDDDIDKFKELAASAVNSSVFADMIHKIVGC